MVNVQRVINLRPVMGYQINVRPKTAKNQEIEGLKNGLWLWKYADDGAVITEAEERKGPELCFVVDLAAPSPL